MLHRPMFADRRMAGKISVELATPKYIYAVWLVWFWVVARKSLITNMVGFLNSTAHCERKKNVTHKAKRMKWKWENKLQAHKYKHA